VTVNWLLVSKAACLWFDLSNLVKSFYRLDADESSGDTTTISPSMTTPSTGSFLTVVFDFKLVSKSRFTNFLTLIG